MIRFLLLWLIVFTSFNEAFGQVAFSYTAGFSSSNHDDLKVLHEQVMENIPLEMRVVNEFEPTIHHIYELSGRFKSSRLAVYYVSKKAGGRLGLQDETGLYVFDQHLSLGSIGVSYQGFLSESFAIGGRVGFVSSKNDIVEKMTIFNRGVIDDSQLLKSNGIEINPHVSYYVDLLKILKVVCEAGYNIDASGNFTLDGNETTIKPNWSGFRLGVGLQVDL